MTLSILWCKLLHCKHCSCLHIHFIVCVTSVSILVIFTQRVAGISQTGNDLELLFQENSQLMLFSVPTLLLYMQEILISFSFSK